MAPFDPIPPDFPDARAAMAGTVISGGSQAGRTLLSLSEESPLLVLFLRHAGCTFCRQTAADLMARRTAVEARGVRPVIVMMSGEAGAAAFLARYSLADVPRVSDPTGRVYRAFGLRRGRFRQLFGVRVLWRGLVAGLVRGHGVGRVEGDPFQMPGAFQVHRGVVVRGEPARDASAQPDLEGLCAV